jgi:hypothetical protein
MPDDIQQPLKPASENQPPTGWMQGMDDSSQIAIQQEIARRRPFIANTTSIAAPPIVLQGEGGLSASAGVRHPTPRRFSFQQELSEQPTAIRDAARVLAQAVEDQAAEWRATGSNDSDAIEFLEWVAGELRKLVEALDRAVEAAAQGSAEQGVFVGRAAQIAKTLNIGLDEFLDRRRADIAGFGVKIGLVAAAYQFLHVCGVDDLSTIASIVIASFRQPKQ